MAGIIIRGTSIAVDYWHHQNSQSIRLSFLTHLHGDHTQGLTSTWRRPIYCSPLTGELLVEHYGVNRSLVQPLEQDQDHLVPYCPSDCRQHSADTIHEKSCRVISVSVVNANHCPGAVMFLFEGPFGKILHTGDFRFSPDMLQSGSILSKHVGSIDSLYLDNTYCSPKFCFPSREEALREILQIVSQHPDHDIVFGLRNLGKEEMLASVARKAEEWINIPQHNFKVMQALDFPNFFTTDQPKQRIRGEPFNKITRQFIGDVNSRKPTVFILPTALDTSPSKNKFVVPYSDHSSYPELVSFVSGLRPFQVWPIVRGKSTGKHCPGYDITNMECFRQHLGQRTTPSGDSASSIEHPIKSSANAPSNQWGNEKAGEPATTYDDLPRLLNKKRKSMDMQRSQRDRILLLGTGVIYDNEM